MIKPRIASQCNFSQKKIKYHPIFISNQFFLGQKVHFSSKKSNVEVLNDEKKKTQFNSINSIIEQDSFDIKKSKILYLKEKQQKILNELVKKFSKPIQKFNVITGYSVVEDLKKDIIELECKLKQSKEKTRISRKEYQISIKNRSDLQRETNELLTRKHNWTSKDLERFTELYRNDHLNKEKENESLKTLENEEKNFEMIQESLTQKILSRYHEEQIWSDKIRKFSTWCTFSLMGLNALIFIIATFLIEPWKRRRLVSAFEQKIKDDLSSLKHSINKITLNTDTIKTNICGDFNSPKKTFYMIIKNFHYDLNLKLFFCKSKINLFVLKIINYIKFYFFKLKL